MGSNRWEGHRADSSGRFVVDVTTPDASSCHQRRSVALSGNRLFRACADVDAGTTLLHGFTLTLTEDGSAVDDGGGGDALLTCLDDVDALIDRVAAAPGVAVDDLLLADRDYVTDGTVWVRQVNADALPPAPLEVRVPIVLCSVRVHLFFFFWPPGDPRRQRPTGAAVGGRRPRSVDVGRRRPIDRRRRRSRPLWSISESDGILSFAIGSATVDDQEERCCLTL